MGSDLSTVPLEMQYVLKCALLSISMYVGQVWSQKYTAARGCGDCACWYSWWSVSRVRNNCVPPAQPETGLSNSLSCSCSCELDMGSCSCYSLGSSVVHVDNKCRNGGEPKTVLGFSCG